MRVEQKANEGLTRTLNELLELASGEYFLCLASDDKILPNALPRAATQPTTNSLSWPSTVMPT